MIEGLIRRTIADIRPYKPGKPIEEVKRELGIEGEVYKLASNENPLGPSPKAISAVKEALNNLNRYPDSACFYLKQKLAKFWGLQPQNFIIGNGSDEIIVLTLRAFLNPGEEVIVSRPSFLIYELASKIEGANLKIVEMKNFRYDLKAIKENITQDTKIIFIANPDNPCGTYLSKGEVEEFISSVPKNVILFFDEAYYEFMDVEDYPDTLKFIDERPLIVTRTFSKAYGLAGLRIGYGIANPKIIECLDKVREPFNVNSLAQIAAEHALDDQEFVSEVKRIVKEGRERLFREFDRLGLEYVKSVTNFILIKVGQESKSLVEYLLRNGVIVRDMRAWGLDSYIRVTVGLKHENEKFVNLLEEFLKKGG